MRNQRRLQSDALGQLSIQYAVLIEIDLLDVSACHQERGRAVGVQDSNRQRGGCSGSEADPPSTWNADQGDGQHNRKRNDDRQRPGNKVQKVGSGQASDPHGSGNAFGGTNGKTSETMTTAVIDIPMRTAAPNEISANASMNT